MAELDLDALRRLADENERWHLRSGLPHGLPLETFRAIIAALERNSELARELTEAQNESEDARRIMAAAQERTKHLEVAAQAVVDVFAIPSGGVGWLARISDLRAVLNPDPGEMERLKAIWARRHAGEPEQEGSDA